ncbi:MAG: hypothetical protein J7K87_00220 [Candidatus Aenigmarchaeota archaeon]|nr:hypothetical protein [Candidatus Aenigmarchaeota archaeon]
MYSTDNIVTQINSTPALQPFLPFFFVLAIVYGLLSMVNVFKGKKAVNFIISLVFAFFAAGYQPFVNMFFTEFGLILWSFVIIFFIAFILEAIGLRGKKKLAEPGKEDLPLIMGGILVLILATVGFGYLSNINIPVIGTENVLLLIGIFLLLLIFYYAYEFGKSGQ